MDLLSTALAAAGITAIAGMDSGPATHPGPFCNQGGQLVARRDKWKLVIKRKLPDRPPAGGQALTGDDALWLSNLEEDPEESRNLRRQQPKLVDELAARATAWRDRRLLLQ